MDRRYHNESRGEDESQEVSAVEEQAETGNGSASRLLLVLEGREIALDKTADDFSVGRHSESDLRANSKTVSRHHLRISWKDDHFIVTDQSSNGTYVRLPGGGTRHLQGESLTLDGEGVMYLGLPPEDPHAVSLAFNVS